MRSIRRQLLVWLLAGLSAGDPRRRDRHVPACARRSERAVRLSAQGNGGVADRRAVRRVYRRPHRARRPARTRWWCRSGTATACSCSCRSRAACCHSTRSSASRPSPPTAGNGAIFSTLSGGQVVQVAQPMSARRELAASLALHTIVPLLAVLPFLVLLIWFTIARGLVAARPGRRRRGAPLADSCSSHCRRPNMPREVQPLVHALNGLLERLGKALAAQRSFIADAAHELRTPLTAVHLQAQLAERADSEAERKAALVRAQGRPRSRDAAVGAVAGAGARGTRRAGPADDARRPRRDRPCGGRRTRRRSLGARASTSVSTRMAPCNVRGDRNALTTLVSNLVDNAVRYTPAAGRVDVIVTDRRRTRRTRSARHRPRHLRR